MFQENTLLDWENLVKKQLKTEDIYSVLNAENLEGVEIHPFQDQIEYPMQNLPKVAESTYLVSKYHQNLEEDVLAFLLEENVEFLSDKSIFINNKDLAEHIKLEDDNKYYSLVDVFEIENGVLNVQLAKELLAKDFKRNICIDVSFTQNCGASIVQQLAIALSKCKELVENFGTGIFNKLIFKIAVGSNYLFEIAKIRALKLLFNQLSKEYNLNEIPFIFAETSIRNKTKSDAENNLIRSTLEISSAMIGGADAVFSNDFRIENNTDLSEEISFKQQIVLAYESIVNVFDDAANGSYFIEDCTQQFAEKSWKKFIQIEKEGGYSCYYQNLKVEILAHAKSEHLWVEEGKIKLVGFNIYPKKETIKSVEDLYQTENLKAVRWSEIYE
ncbi:methylmalonyl-CoA mutase family protein [Frigoriflavimonas asaccharolytica]|uniref:Methylmalonyl-CoA mutase n=1 Tax=Frigoriflavimonas asaccharolytica TaxID=2735899 RepID=A0A8J8G9E2_9FLAO|nr:methylmalonyl-CoA mutase family protein [Frigoriflavimonas asaccharolytica]NRS91934.1 methylmalonyl-CoA mutase [Frigoriflavimonas asaccharolytica]